MIHTPLGLVAEITPLFTRSMHFYPDVAFYIKKCNYLSAEKLRWKQQKCHHTLKRAKPSEWWQAPWLSDKRAAGFNTLHTLLIRSLWCSQLRKLVRHQKSLWYRMLLLRIALIPGYSFLVSYSIDVEQAPHRASSCYYLIIHTEYVLYICPPPPSPLKKKETRSLNTWHCHMRQSYSPHPY